MPSGRACGTAAADWRRSLGADASHPDRVVKKSEKDSLYAAMDVFAMPSLYEGLSMALLEAQASGLPCLASDTVSPESNVTNRMVRLPLEQPKDWAVAFEKQLKAPADRTRDVTEAFARRNLDIHTAVRQLTELYERN